MTDAESIAVELAKEYGLKAVRFISTPKFQTVTSAALELMTAAEVLDGVFEGGGLNGLFNPYGGIISRIEKLVAESAFSRQLSEDAAERADWAARGRAASRGETLAELVARGEIYPDEAEEAIDGEFAEAEFRAIAVDALRGEAPMTRGPVHDADIEDAVIGGLLVANSSLDEVLATGLAAEDFYVPSHSYAFAAICSLALRGQPVDNLTVAGEVRALGPAGPSGADLVASMVNAPVASHLPAYAKRIRGLARMRALVAAGHELVELGTTPTSDVEAVLGQAEQLVLAATSTGREDTGSSLAVEMVDELLGELRARQDGTAPLPVSTGSVDLDRQLHGGFRPGQLVVLGARPSMGKTALVIGMAVAAASRDVPTLYCSLEMSRAEVAERFLAMDGVSTDVQAAGLSERDWARAEVAREKLRTWPLRVDDDAAATMLTVRSRARRMASRQGLGLVIVDYLQLLTHRETENRQTQVAEISRELKRLARELSVPVIAVSQLSRNLEAREDKVPRLADLRESGQLEQDADAVLFLHRPVVYDEKADPGEAQVIVAKHRNGPTGLVRLVWLPKRMRFADPSRREAA